MDASQFELLLHEDESATLDFKRDQYPFAKASDDRSSKFCQRALPSGRAASNAMGDDAEVHAGLLPDLEECLTFAGAVTAPQEEANLHFFKLRSLPK